MKRSIFIAAALILASIAILYTARFHMGVIESSIYKCQDGSELNFGGWWAEPLPVPGNDNLFFVCGGNVPGEKKGIGTGRCVKVDLLSCTAQELPSKMSSARQDLRPTCLSKGRCYLFGGYTEKESDAAKDVDLLTLGDGSVTGTPLNVPQRLCYASAAIGDTRFIATGGYGVKDPASGLGQALNSATLVDTADGEIESVPMNFQRSSHSMTRLSDGKLLLIGGSGDDPKGAEVFDPATNSFTKIEAKMGAARKDHRAIFASDGLVYIMGGTSPIDKSQPRAIEVYDPETKEFRTTAMELSVGREDIAAVYIEELNIIVVAGGEIKGAPGEPESSAIDLIDLNQNKVISGTLKSPKDEAHIIVRAVDSKAQTAKLLVLGMEKRNDREVPSPAEVVNISLSSLQAPASAVPDRITDVAFVLYDAGETKALLPVMDYLDAKGVPFKVIAGGTARELMSQEGNPHRDDLVDLNRDCGITSVIDKDRWQRRQALPASDALRLGKCIAPKLVVSGMASMFQRQAVREIDETQGSDAWGYYDGFSAVGIADPASEYYIDPAFANDLSRTLVASTSVAEAFKKVMEKEKVFIVGQPTVEDWRASVAKEDPAQVKEELGLDPKKQTILYAGGYGEGYEAAFRAFAKDAAKMDGYNIVVSLHPKADGNLEQRILKESGADKVKVILGDKRKAMPTKRAAVASDLIVVWRSSVGTQALFMGKRVIYLDTAPGYRDDAITSGLALQVIEGNGKTAFKDAVVQRMRDEAPSTDDIYAKTGIPSGSTVNIGEMIRSFRKPSKL